RRRAGEGLALLTRLAEGLPSHSAGFPERSGSVGNRRDYIRRDGDEPARLIIMQRRDPVVASRWRSEPTRYPAPSSAQAGLRRMGQHLLAADRRGKVLSRLLSAGWARCRR